MVRKAMVERHPRESFKPATKLPPWMLCQKDDRERIFCEQLEKCGVRYFDYYLLHSITGEFYKNAERLDCFSITVHRYQTGFMRFGYGPIPK
jgi:predicted aldo/keto reductase-like oxidoreductase